MSTSVILTAGSSRGVGADALRMDMMVITTLLSPASGGYVGFGFGASMSGADIYSIMVTGGSATCAVTVSDCHGVGAQAPAVDAVNNILPGTLAYQYFAEEGKYQVAWSRFLDTGDADDAVISTGSNSIIFAHKSGSFSYHGRTNRQQIKLDFSTADASLAATANNILGLHGVLMYTTFGIAYPFAQILARYFKSWPHWLVVHALLGKLSLTNVLSMTLTSLVFINQQNEYSAHGKVGICLSIGVAIQVISGYANVYYLKNEQRCCHGKIDFLRAIKRLHFIIGMGLVLTGQFQIALGIGRFFLDSGNEAFTSVSSTGYKM